MSSQLNKVVKSVIPNDTDKIHYLPRCVGNLFDNHPELRGDDITELNVCSLYLELLVLFYSSNSNDHDEGREWVDSLTAPELHSVIQSEIDFNPSVVDDSPTLELYEAMQGQYEKLLSEAGNPATAGNHDLQVMVSELETVRCG